MTNASTISNAIDDVTTSATSANVLVVEDDLALQEAIVDTLELARFTVIAASSGEQALERIEQHHVDMVISDVNMGGMDGHELLDTIKKNKPLLPVLLITAFGSIDRSVRAIQAGAVDYLVKPFEPGVLIDLVRHHTIGQTSGEQEPIAVAAVSKQLFQLARRVANTDSTVLISGESGTGKEVMARYIHSNSPRNKSPFIAINCAAIPESMLEATLFGHEKGAFTGAHQSMPGKFEQANGGTLLLDEISEMDLALQAKLLRVLQEREVERVGGRRIIDLDVRIVATTNRDLRSYVDSGRFREDLFYRLSVFPICWPSLRERTDDIVPIASQLLARHAVKMGRGKVNFSAAAEQSLLSYRWPGNVRELDNVVQRALIFNSTSTIEDGDLLFDTQTRADGNALSHGRGLVIQAFPGRAPEKRVESHELNGVAGETTDADIAHSNAFDKLNGDNIGPSDTVPGGELPQQDESGAALGQDLQQREFEIILQTLEKTRGSRKAAAEKLGISPRTLRYKLAKMREAGLEP